MPKKESDEEFLKRMKKIQENVSKKSIDLKKEFSNEYEQGRESGIKVGKVFEELEQCRNIQKEFEANPPIQKTIHVNGNLVEIIYDEKFQNKVDILKKHCISFPSAVNDTSYFTIEFSTFGNVFLKRGINKIPLPESSEDLPIIIKDGDSIITEKNSYLLDLKDYEQAEENSIHIFMYPQSELRLSISEKKDNPAPGYMDPSKVSLAVKKNSKITRYHYKIKQIELLKGIFNISIERKSGNPNSLIKIPSKYPQIEFKGQGELFSNLINNEIEKMRQANKGLADAYEKKVSESLIMTKSQKINSLSSIIELSENGSLVLFGTMNQISSSGKVSKKLAKDPFNPIKVTLIGNKMYETDCSKSPDLRVREIIKRRNDFTQYMTFLSTKKSFTNMLTGKSEDLDKAKEMVKLAEKIADKELIMIAKRKLKKAEDDFNRNQTLKKRESDPNYKKSQEEEMDKMMQTAKESGDDELIEVAKAMKAGLDRPQIGGVDPSYINTMIRNADKNLNELAPELEKGLPSYSAPIESDKV